MLRDIYNISITEVYKMKILPNKRLSFIIAGCIAVLLFSSSLFSGLLSTTSTGIGTHVALASNYLIPQAVAQDTEMDEQTTQDTEMDEQTTPPDGGEGETVTEEPPSFEVEEVEPIIEYTCPPNSKFCYCDPNKPSMLAGSDCDDMVWEVCGGENPGTYYRGVKSDGTEYGYCVNENRE